MKYLLLTLPICLLIACAAKKQPPPSYKLTGELEAPKCDGYNVLDAPVTIRNESNTVIATTTASLDHTRSQASCTVQFAATVPREAFYQIRVGTHDGPSYSFDQMQAMHWAMDLSLP